MTDQTVLHVPQSEIHDAFIRACNEELQALKPGNVHVFAPGHDMDVAQFEMSATAAAPYIADPELSVGARIKGAVKASMKAAGCNTNLGIVLLCAPLAAAAGRVQAEANVSERLKATLADLTPQDADDVFAAIRFANPGGLGTADKADVRSTPGTLGLIEAMRLSARFDRIANAYITAFEDIFTHHLPVLAQARRQIGPDTPATDKRVVTTLFMRLLQDFPDSHIGRKFGAEAARGVQTRAAALKATWEPPQDGPKAHQKLLAFDQELKSQGLNPGTTADFVVATLFADRMFRRFAAH